MIDAQEAVVNTHMTRRIAAWFVVPWSGFVAAFLYYTLLTVLLIGGLSPQTPVVALAYVAPLLAYSAAIALRLAGAVAAHAARATATRAPAYAVARGA